MKKALLILSMLMSTLSVQAYNPELDSSVKMIDSCLETNKILLCNDEVLTTIKSLSLNVRGEFAMLLREKFNANKSELVIKNLYNKLQPIVQIYVDLDTCEQWSCRAIKNLQDDISVEYVKVSEINKDLLIKLYKNQATQNGRYDLLTTLSNKVESLTKIVEIESLIKFAEFAKDYSLSINDEPYLFNTAVDIIRRLSVKQTSINPGHEGIFSLVFDNAEAAKLLNIDKVVVMESNGRDSLVVNFVSSSLKVVKMSFTGAAILGNTIFSNQDVYNNQQDVSNPYFKFELNRETKTISGVFSSARFGAMSFKGSLVASNISVYGQNTVKGLSLSQLVGSHKVKVGNYEMTLVIKKRTDERTATEAALFNDNAMISFSKVTLDSNKGVVTLVDYNNEKKLTLAITSFDEKAQFNGQFLNAPLSKILDVSSL